MQLLENSVLGLRAARHRLTSPTSPVTVSLFPMVHVGETGYFRRVRELATEHDIVLTEGVRSRVTLHLTRSYRWIDFERLGLVVQPTAPFAGSAKVRSVHADLSGEEFEAQWRKVPLRLRMAIYFLSPLVGLHRRLFASRQTLADRMSLEDRQSSEEVLDWDPEWAALMHSILHSRDARLVERLREELDNPDTEPRTLAIVYGAMHMRAVLTELASRDFRSVESEWLTVFAL